MKACHCSCLSLFFIDSKRRQRKDLLTVHTIIYKLRVEGEDRVRCVREGGSCGGGEKGKGGEGKSGNGRRVTDVTDCVNLSA